MVAECLTLNPGFLQFKISRFQYSWASSFYADFIFIFREEEGCSVLYEFPWQLWLWISLSRGCGRTYSRVQSRSLSFSLISFTREICFISFFLFNFFYTWDLLYLFRSLQFLLLMRSAFSLSFSLKSFSLTSFVCSTCKGEITEWNNFHLVPYFEEFPRCVIVRTVSFLDFIWENSWNVSYFELARRGRAIMQWVFCPHSQLFAQYLSYAICPHNSS
jgi:hypothetical protein